MVAAGTGEALPLRRLRSPQSLCRGCPQTTTGGWYDFGFMSGIGAYASNHEVRQGVLGTPR